MLVAVESGRTCSEADPGLSGRRREVGVRRVVDVPRGIRVTVALLTGLHGGEHPRRDLDGDVGATARAGRAEHHHVGAHRGAAAVRVVSVAVAVHERRASVLPERAQHERAQRG